MGNDLAKDRGFKGILRIIAGVSTYNEGRKEHD